MDRWESVNKANVFNKNYKKGFAQNRFKREQFKNITESSQFKRWFGDWQNDPKHASRVVNAAESLSVTSSI